MTRPFYKRLRRLFEGRGAADPKAADRKYQPIIDFDFENLGSFKDERLFKVCSFLVSKLYVFTEQGRITVYLTPPDRKELLRILGHGGYAECVAGHDMLFELIFQAGKKLLDQPQKEVVKKISLACCKYF